MYKRQVLQGVTDVRKLFDYTLCARSGHTGIVERMEFGANGPPSPEEARALGGRLGATAMTAALVRTEVQCKDLPQTTLVLRGDALTFGGRVPDASQFDYVACAANDHISWLKGIDFGGKELDEAEVERQVNELFLRVVADYLGLDIDA